MPRRIERRIVPSICHRALGRVALWGTVVEGELGWRASRAYPQEIFLPANGAKHRVGLEAIVEGLSVYGVPIGIVDGDGQRLAKLVTGSESPQSAIIFPDLRHATARSI